MHLIIIKMNVDIDNLKQLDKNKVKMSVTQIYRFKK